MARYTYLCDKEDGGCNHSFEISCTIAEYQEKHVDRRHTCPKCRKRKPVRRDFMTDTLSYIGDATPKTLGGQCDKNSRKISVDEKHHLTTKHNEYKEVTPLRELPDGMSRIKE